MKKGIILSVIALCLLALPSKAQEPVRNVEFEMGFGGGVAIWSGKNYGSFEFKMELRYNLPDSHWDLGTYFAAGTTISQKQHDKYDYSYLKEVTTYMLPVIDYNWRRGEKISYFVGSGIGIYISDTKHATNTGVSIMPRAGVEFFNRLRLTADYKWNIQGLYNYLNFSAGFVFGGGKKKSTEHKQSHKRFKEYEKAQN